MLSKRMFPCDGRSKKSILITGASGMVGHGLLDLLRYSKKFNVIGVYNKRRPRIEGENIKYIRANLVKKEGWDKLTGGIYGLIHCAAIIPSSYEGNKREGLYTDNTAIDRLAIAHALKEKAKFIYVSTVGVYGFNIKGVYDECFEINPLGEYFIGKADSEKEIISKKGSLGYYIFRISAPYGPYQRNITVLKTFINNAIENKPIYYYGTGSRMQDFIYVKDIALACLKALNCENYGIYNIASSSPITMKNLAAKIKKIYGSASEIKEAGIPDPQEGHSPIFDISKAGRLLGWKPQYTLDKGLAELIGYLRRK